jgi:methylamine--corrinoid protein Co-methyltransferase
MTNVSFSEVLDRTYRTGSMCEPKDWDMKVIPSKVSEKLKEYGLKGACTPENPIPCDNDLADRFWKAGFELAVEVGMLSTSTRRVIKFSEQELKDYLSETPSKLTLGEGKDQVILRKRSIEDKKLPIGFNGAGGDPIREELFIPISQSFLQYKNVQIATIGFLNNYYGNPIMASTPIEFVAFKRISELTKEVARRVGRPKMPIAYGGITEYGVMGCALAFEPKLSVPCHAAITELKTDDSALHKVAIGVERGDALYGIHNSLIGGYSGPPEGVVVSLIAATILLSPVYQAQIFSSSIFDRRYPSNDSREALWANSVAGQAIARNSNFIFAGLCQPAAGPCTEMLFYEIGVGAMRSSVDGYAYIHTGRAGKHPEYLTGLESSFGIDIGRAVAGMKREDVNEIIKKILPKYELKIKDPPLGKSFLECTDLRTLKPSEEHINIVRKVSKEFLDLGIPLDNTF